MASPDCVVRLGVRRWVRRSWWSLHRVGLALRPWAGVTRTAESSFGGNVGGYRSGSGWSTYVSTQPM